MSEEDREQFNKARKEIPALVATAIAQDVPLAVTVNGKEFTLSPNLLKIFAQFAGVSRGMVEHMFCVHAEGEECPKTTSPLAAAPMTAEEIDQLSRG